MSGWGRRNHKWKGPEVTLSLVCLRDRELPLTGLDGRRECVEIGTLSVAFVKNCFPRWGRDWMVRVSIDWFSIASAVPGVVSVHGGL